MSWEWPVIIYLWVAGIGGGAYFVTFLAHRLSGGQYFGAKRVAAALGVPAVVFGVIMLVVDLGHPFRAWHLFVRFRPVSPMSMGSWMLFVWAVLAVILFLTWWAESLNEKRVTGGLAQLVGFFKGVKRVAGLLDWVTFILSILLIAYTGVLLSATSQPLWASTPLLPVLFVSSAIATGVAAVNLIGALGVPHVGMPLMSKLCKGASVVCVVEILSLAGLLILVAISPEAVAYAAGRVSGPIFEGATTEAVQSVNSLLTGSLSFPFWVGVVLVGLLLPLGVELSLILRDVKSTPREVAGLLAIMVLAGGLTLRAVIVFGGQL
jgi:polysulfide reductase chain C